MISKDITKVKFFNLLKQGLERPFTKEEVVDCFEVIGSGDFFRECFQTKEFQEITKQYEDKLENDNPLKYKDIKERYVNKNDLEQLNFLLYYFIANYYLGVFDYGFKPVKHLCFDLKFNTLIDAAIETYFREHLDIIHFELGMSQNLFYFRPNEENFDDIVTEWVGKPPLLYDKEIAEHYVRFLFHLVNTIKNNDIILSNKSQSKLESVARYVYNYYFITGSSCILNLNYIRDNLLVRKEIIK